MKPNLTKLRQVFFFPALLYFLYLGKSALGIELSANYSVPQLFKYPLMAADCVLPITGNYCHHLKHDASLQES